MRELLQECQYARHVHTIALLPGDGIGPEVTAVARAVLERLAQAGLPLQLWELDLGADRYLRDGTTLPKEVFTRIATQCDAVLLGAFGDRRVPNNEHARDIVLGLRQRLELFANVRPCCAMVDRLVPLVGRRAEDVDFVIVRENTEGAYLDIGGALRTYTTQEVALEVDVSTRLGVERVLRFAFELAAQRRKKCLHMTDKANAQRFGGGLWQRTFRELAADYPEVEARHLYADALCYELVRDPSRFSVIVASNLFGDLLSDLGAALSGGLGLAPSANVRSGFGTPGGRQVAVFEPVHGSALELVGRNMANPFASILSVAMMLAHLGYPMLEQRLSGLVCRAIELGVCTPDAGGSKGTDEVRRWYLDALEEDLARSPLLAEQADAEGS